MAGLVWWHVGIRIQVGNAWWGVFFEDARQHINAVAQNLSKYASATHPLVHKTPLLYNHRHKKTFCLRRLQVWIIVVDKITTPRFWYNSTKNIKRYRPFFEAYINKVSIYDSDVKCVFKLKKHLQLAIKTILYLLLFFSTYKPTVHAGDLFGNLKPKLNKLHWCDKIPERTISLSP